MNETIELDHLLELIEESMGNPDHFFKGTLDEVYERRKTLVNRNGFALFFIREEHAFRSMAKSDPKKYLEELRLERGNVSEIWLFEGHLRDSRYRDCSAMLVRRALARYMLNTLEHPILTAGLALHHACLITRIYNKRGIIDYHHVPTV